VQQQICHEISREMVGQTLEVMVEGESKLVSRRNASLSKIELGWEKRSAAVQSNRDTQLVGRTRGDLVVCFQGPLSLKGDLLDVQITDAQGMTLFGKLVEASTLAR
jgi:tRNA A37 methylthiotransferase MiaB